jgi:hypothetical protein
LLKYERRVGRSPGSNADFQLHMSLFCENPFPIFPKWWFKLNKANDNWQLPFGFRQPALGVGWKSLFHKCQRCMTEFRKL